MAGFLGMFNYSKPGPGVTKDGPEKKRYVIFFEIYFRKFWQLISSNLLFVVCCLPFFVPFFAASMLRITNVFVLYITLMPLSGIAVVVSGHTYIMRNFAREEHAFIWSDFVETIKTNWKQSLAVGFIDYCFVTIMYISMNFYNHYINKYSVLVIPVIICFFMCVTFAFMNYYIFVLLITFDLKFRPLIRNAFIFSAAGLGRNILITLIIGLNILAMYLFPVAILLIPFLAVSSIGLLINFMVWPLVEKFMIPADAVDKTGKDDSIFSDKG